MSKLVSSPFAQLAEHRIALGQTQLDRARQLVERYRNTHDFYEMMSLQKELLTILGRLDPDGRDNLPHALTMVIAARFSGALWRESRVVVDPELLLALFTRFGLTPKVREESNGTDMYQPSPITEKEDTRV